MRKRFTARFVNGVLAALITLVFLVHAIMGALSGAAGFSNSFAWIVWGAVVLAGAHVVASVVTSAQQLDDKQRPPSPRKKRHLALKWATGGVLAVLAAAHVVVPKSAAASSFLMIVLCAALAVHLCVGSKSLLKDLEIDRRHKRAFQVVVCALLGVAAVVVLIGVVLYA